MNKSILILLQNEDLDLYDYVFLKAVEDENRDLLQFINTELNLPNIIPYQKLWRKGIIDEDNNILEKGTELLTKLKELE